MTNLFKKTFIILIISFMSLKSAHTNDKVTLLLDWFINPDHGPVIIASEKGIFKDAGLEIEIIPKPEATIKESIATGPTASCLDVPKIAYTIYIMY